MLNLIMLCFIFILFFILSNYTNAILFQAHIYSLLLTSFRILWNKCEPRSSKYIFSCVLLTVSCLKFEKWRCKKMILINSINTFPTAHNFMSSVKWIFHYFFFFISFTLNVGELLKEKLCGFYTKLCIR